MSKMASGSPAEIVRAAVVSADRRRRARETSHTVWRLAPIAAGAALLAAVGHRWTGWSSAIPLTLLIAGASGLALYAYVGRRLRPVTDAIASRVDADARLNGELRSATWFAASSERDSWADFHLERAADRVAATDWTSLYPSVRRARLWAATAAMAFAALVLSVTLPVRTIASSAGTSAVVEAAKHPQPDAASFILPPELQKKLEELLAGIENGSLKNTEALKSAGDLKDLLALLSQQMDPDLRKKLELAALEAAARGDKRSDPAKLAERARRDASKLNTPSELQKALEELAKELDKNAEEQNAAAGSPNATPQADAEGAPEVQASQEGKSDSNEAMVQFARDSAGGASQASMVSMGLSSNDPRPGEGGNQGGRRGEMPPELAQALRRETVEAAMDTTGENVTTELRRKTEQGRATASYTHAAAGTFDRARAAAPPPVPEARRAQVQSYFIRKQ